MIRLIIILVVVLSSPLAFAKLSHLSCSENGTKVFYINGIGYRDDKDLDQGTINFLSSLTPKHVDNKSIISFGRITNRSQGIAKDIVKTIYLSLENQGFPLTTSTLKLVSKALFDNSCVAATDDFFKKICREMYAIKQSGLAANTQMELGLIFNQISSVLNMGTKIVLVSHSGGAVYGDAILSFVKERMPSKFDFISLVSVARPVKVLHEDKTRYLNFSNDEVLNLISTYQDTPKSNSSIENASCKFTNSPNETDIFFRNHSMDCYTSDLLVTGSTEITQNSNLTANLLLSDIIYQSSGTLENNDLNCCSRKSGKVWQNPDGSVGGFVRSDFTINDENFKLHQSSQLCNYGFIKRDITGISSEIGANTKLEGNFFASGYFSFGAVKSKSGTRFDITNTTSSPKFFGMSDVIINRNFQINNANNLFILNVEINSPLRLEGGCAFGNGGFGIRNINFIGSESTFFKNVDLMGTSLSKIQVSKAYLSGECSSSISERIAIKTPSSFENLKVYNSASIEAAIGDDVTIGPNSHQNNPTLVLPGFIFSSSIADGTRILQNAFIRGCSISGDIPNNYSCFDAGK